MLLRPETTVTEAAAVAVAVDDDDDAAKAAKAPSLAAMDWTAAGSMFIICESTEK